MRKTSTSGPGCASRHPGGRWELFSEGGEALGDFDLLIISAPAPQAEVLLRESAPHLAAQAAAAEYSPAWAVMFALSIDPQLPYDGLFFEDSGIAWAARNDSKPGRRGNSWVIHAAPEWTRMHLDASSDEVATELVSILAELVELDTAGVVDVSAHRWRVPAL